MYATEEGKVPYQQFLAIYPIGVEEMRERDVLWKLNTVEKIYRKRKIGNVNNVNI